MSHTISVSLSAKEISRHETVSPFLYPVSDINIKDRNEFTKEMLHSVYGVVPVCMRQFDHPTVFRDSSVPLMSEKDLRLNPKTEDKENVPAEDSSKPPDFWSNISEILSNNKSRAMIKREPVIIVIPLKGQAPRQDKTGRVYSTYEVTDLLSHENKISTAHIMFYESSHDPFKRMNENCLVLIKSPKLLQARSTESGLRQFLSQTWVVESVHQVLVIGKLDGLVSCPGKIRTTNSCGYLHLTNKTIAEKQLFAISRDGGNVAPHGSDITDLEKVVHGPIRYSSVDHCNRCNLAVKQARRELLLADPLVRSSLNKLPELYTDEELETLKKMRKHKEAGVLLRANLESIKNDMNDDVKERQLRSKEIATENKAIGVDTPRSVALRKLRKQHGHSTQTKAFVTQKQEDTMKVSEIIKSLKLFLNSAPIERDVFTAFSITCKAQEIFEIAKSEDEQLNEMQEHAMKVAAIALKRCKTDSVQSPPGEWTSFLGKFLTLKKQLSNVEKKVNPY